MISFESPVHSEAIEGSLVSVDQKLTELELIN